MIDRDTFFRVKQWFILCLEMNRNEIAFEEDLLSYKFNFSKELIGFLDEVNDVQYARCKSNALCCSGGIWERNALNSILEEAKKFKILKNDIRVTSEECRHEAIQELIQKMKNWRPYCMLVRDFLANSKPTNMPKKYTNLCVLCKYWVSCQKALKKNRKLDELTFFGNIIE